MMRNNIKVSCTWCASERDEEFCSYCTVEYKKPIPTDPKRQAEEIHSLCNKLVGSSTGQYPLEISADIVVDRLKRLVGRDDIKLRELLNPEVLVAEAAPILGADSDDIVVKLATKHDIPAGKLAAVIQEYENWRAGK